MLTLALLVAGVGVANAQGETDITTLPWVTKGQGCTQDFNNANGGTVYGTDVGGTNLSYVDVSAYGTIKLYGTASQRARLFINREEYGDNGTFYVDINSEGVGTFDCNTVLTQQPLAQYIHLNGVKASAWDTHLNLSQITVSGSAITFPEAFNLPDGEVEINSLPWVNQGNGCANNLGSDTGSTIYGTDAGPSDGNLSYIDATDYSAVKLYGSDGTVRLFINRAEYSSGTYQFNVTITDGVGTLNLADVYAVQSGATYIHINGVKALYGATAKVNHITLVEKPFEFSEGVTDLTTLPFVNEGQGCVNNLGTSTDATLYGTDAGPSDDNLSYIDVTNYSAVKLYGAAGDVVRLFINRAEYSSGTYTFFVTIGEDGVGTLNLADVYAAQSGATYVHINGFKASQTWAATPDADGKALVKYIGVVDAISVTTGSAPYNYVLTGSGELTVPATRALADEAATAIDATGITKATALATANPNCLITANAGMVTNSQNVIVGGTCANLVLTDGHPFKAPADFTATTASYTTTINAEAGAGTLCLPFEATIPGDVSAYTLTYTGGDKATATPVETTIPANTPVLLNGSGEKTFTGSGAVAAEATNTAGNMTGVFASGAVPTNSYVLQNGSDGIGFYKVDSDPITINPFRAYLTASAGVHSLTVDYQNGEETGIQTVDNAQQAKDNAIFDLSGRRVVKAQKGIYIVNGKKIVK